MHLFEAFLGLTPPSGFEKVEMGHIVPALLHTYAASSSPHKLVTLLVPREGLEPSRVSSIDFESIASTIPPSRQWAHHTAFSRAYEAPLSPSAEPALPADTLRDALEPPLQHFVQFAKEAHVPLFAECPIPPLPLGR